MRCELQQMQNWRLMEVRLIWPTSPVDSEPVEELAVFLVEFQLNENCHGLTGIPTTFCLYYFQKSLLMTEIISTW